MRYISIISIMWLPFFPNFSYAEQDNKQCDLIAQLTGDYYVHRAEGKTKEQVIEKYKPDFGGAEFERTIDLAINMAYTLPEGKTRDTVVEDIYQQCLHYQ